MDKEKKKKVLLLISLISLVVVAVIVMLVSGIEFRNNNKIDNIVERNLGDIVYRYNLVSGSNESCGSIRQKNALPSSSDDITNNDTWPEYICVPYTVSVSRQYEKRQEYVYTTNLGTDDGKDSCQDYSDYETVTSPPSPRTTEDLGEKLCYMTPLEDNNKIYLYTRSIEYRYVYKQNSCDANVTVKNSIPDNPNANSESKICVTTEEEKYNYYQKQSYENGIGGCTDGQYWDGNNCQNCPASYPNSDVNSDGTQPQSKCYLEREAGEGVYIAREGTIKCPSGSYYDGNENKKVYYGSFGLCESCPSDKPNTSDSGSTNEEECNNNGYSGTFTHVKIGETGYLARGNKERIIQRAEIVESDPKDPEKTPVLRIISVSPYLITYVGVNEGSATLKYYYKLSSTNIEESTEIVIDVSTCDEGKINVNGTCVDSTGCSIESVTIGSKICAADKPYYPVTVRVSGNSCTGSYLYYSVNNNTKFQINNANNEQTQRITISQYNNSYMAKVVPRGDDFDGTQLIFTAKINSDGEEKTATTKTTAGSCLSKYDLSLNPKKIYLPRTNNDQYSDKVVVANITRDDNSNASIVDWSKVTGIASAYNITTEGFINGKMATIKGISGGSGNTCTSQTYKIEARATGSETSDDDELTVCVYCSKWKETKGTYTFDEAQSDRIGMLIKPGCDAYEDRDIEITDKYVYKTKYNRCCGSGGTSTASACYANSPNLEEATAVAWRTSSDKTYPYEISGVSKDNCKASACYVSADGNTYTWATSAPSGYTKANNIQVKSECKKEDDACYKDSTGSYHWGKFKTTVGYILIPGADENSCKAEGKCYVKDNDYKWSDTKPEGYTETNKPQEECRVSNEACYIYNGSYVWGDYSTKTGYTLTPIEDEMYCVKAADACYLGPDNKYHIGDYSLDNEYSLVEDSKCGNEVPVPKTDLNVGTIIYIAMGILFVTGIGFVYYANTKKKFD